MKRLFTLLSLVLLTSAAATAQRTVRGVVQGADQEPLIGANVVVKGTNVGTTTDLDGAFSIELPGTSNVLVVSYTGYETQEVAITASNQYTVVLAESALGLEEVVVVGYGTQQKRNITGTVASIKGEDIASMSVQSFDQALQGRAAGVNVSIPNGVLNNPPVFRIRGINSINLSSFPLIVIDGVPTFAGDLSANSAANNVLSNLNPSDIQSIEILKDASAAAIYGSRASAGVVLITTKRGKQGRTKVTYDAWGSWAKVNRLPELLNAEQYLEIKNEGARNANLPQQFFPQVINGQTVDTRWYDYVYRTGFSQNHNLSFSGGSDKTTYFLSMGYTNQEGMIVANAFERKSARLNLDHRVSKAFSLGASVGYSDNFNSAPNTGSLPGQAFNTAGLGRIPLITAPIVGPFNADGSYNIASNNQIGRASNLQQTGFYNPVPIIDLNTFTSESSQIQASVFANITPVKGLTLRTQYGIDNVLTESISFQSPIHGDGFGSNGSATNTYANRQRWNWQNTLQYDLTLADKHNFSLLGGNEQQYTVSNGWGANRTVIADPFFTTFQGNFTTIVPSGNFQGENFLLSYFGRLNYDFNKKYLITFNLRQDEYSAFAPGKKRGVFWGASAGWTISEEAFWQNSLGSVVNYLRLRGSYGEVGNNNGIGDFASLGLYGSGLYAPDPTLVFSQAGNPDLSWETSKKTDVGINFGLFNDRITGEITYFQNLIDGLILNAPLSPSKGVPGNSIATNIGSMQNVGWEFGLSGTAVRKGKFSWNTNFNFTFMENEVKSLAAGNADILSSTGGLETSNIIRVGASVGSLFVVETRGVNPANGRRIFVNSKGEEVQYTHVVGAGQSRWTYLDGRTAAAVNQATDGRIYGPTLPKWFGAWDNTFRYGNLDFNFQLQYSGGNYIYNGTKAGLRDARFWNSHTDVLDRWTETNTDGSIPRVVFGDNISNGSAIPISENVEKGDFMRLRNVTLGYNIPSSVFGSKFRISSLRVYGNINNALLLTNYTGTDPEVSTNGNSNQSPGVDRNSVPMARTFLVGLNVGF
ncbi:MAG: SusC/RagA family TonB-linked outer membrane protein [Saprospiraceae bacterium]|jgi:TonB-linked SusC/RagA family outer membrane protein